MAAARRPSFTEINAMNKEQLKKNLKDIIRELDQEKDAANANPVADEDSMASTDLLASILSEIKALRKEKLDLKKRVESLEEQSKTLADAAFQHQRFLETIDAAKRACNLIITGVPEEGVLTAPATGDKPAITATTDDEKVSLVLKKIKQDTKETVVEAKRLGKKHTGENSRPRPIKVITSTPQERNGVLNHAKDLKNAGNGFAKIFIKKDIHPIVRKELNRMKSAEYNEKQGL